MTCIYFISMVNRDFYRIPLPFPRGARYANEAWPLISSRPDRWITPHRRFTSSVSYTRGGGRKEREEGRKVLHGLCFRPVHCRLLWKKKIICNVSNINPLLSTTFVSWNIITRRVMRECGVRCKLQIMFYGKAYCDQHRFV